MEGRASKNFLWSEFACRCGCGAMWVTDRAVHKIQLFRDIIGGPVYFSSVCRCPIHNARERGKPLSSHRSTILRPSCAFDVQLRGRDKQLVIDAGVEAGFGGIGINYNTFVHFDDRDGRFRW